MEWFKHKTNAHDDPVISSAWEKFGDAGYVVWFVLLELYASNYNSKNPEAGLRINRKVLARKFRKRSTTSELLLNFFSTSGKLTLTKVEEDYIIQIPKFTEILSNWSRRKTTPTEAPTEGPTAVDKSKSKSKIKNIIYTKSFLDFWLLYPNKVGKGAAFNSWQRIGKNGGITVPNILEAVRQQIKSPKWQKDGGQFIPNPSTWLNQRRWEDEIETTIVAPRPETEEEKWIRKHGKP
jgi:hypothetical protein